jgi:hypothetical protein
VNTDTPSDAQNQARAKDMTPPPASPHSQGKRRVKYGLNVAVAALAAGCLVVLINWIGHRQFVRFDLTSTRRYSLSQQTRNLLAELQGEYRLITLFSVEGPYATQARELIEQTHDLVDEYGHYAKNLTIEHLNPASDPAGIDRFFASLRDRYRDPMGPTESAISQGREAIASIRQASAQLGDQLQRVLDDPSLTDAEFKRFIQTIAKVFARVESDLANQDREIEQHLSDPLPNYTRVCASLQNLLGQLDERVYSATITEFTHAAENEQLPNSTRDSVLKMNEHLRRQQASIKAANESLTNLKPIEDYDQIVNRLASPQTLVAIGPKQVRVLNLADLYRPSMSQDPGQEDPETKLEFQGEEKITGALLSLSRDKQPLVVFVSEMPGQAMGQRGEYEQVITRLRNLGFKVEQWSPGGQQNPTDEPRPSDDQPPEPEPGQKVVWVLLPNPAAMMGQSPLGGMPNDSRTYDLIQARLAKGEGAMLILTASAGSRFGAPDPSQDLLKEWGITPQLDRVLLQQVNLANDQTRSIPQMDVSTWPTGLTVTQSLAGMPGVFIQASPLVLSGEKEGVKTWSLAEVSGKDIWAERDYMSEQNIELDPASAGGPFVIGAAAERDHTRLVVVADPIWATDQVTTYGLLGPGTAEIVGARFPGNSELFVNSVNWLAGLDSLIAASARAQDIRRVQPMTLSELVGLRWTVLLGLPSAIAVIGVGVWFVRRAG